MNTTEKKLNYIISNINNVVNYSKFVKQAKKEKINYYNQNKKHLNNIDTKKIHEHNFDTEVLKLSELLEKKSYKNKLYKCIDKLEIHNYSPEQNKLHFLNKDYVLVSNKFKINDAIETIIKKYSISYIKNILLSNKIKL